MVMIVSAATTTCLWFQWPQLICIWLDKRADNNARDEHG